jgi:hypothetical protein
MTTHPQQDRPTKAVIRQMLEARDPALRNLYFAVHDLVRETLPDARYTIDLTDGMMGYGSRQYGADGWGVAFLACHAKWVSLGLFNGAHLPDPHRRLEGSGKNMRHVKVHSAEQLADWREDIRALILAATEARRE